MRPAGWHHTDETRAKISASRTGLKVTGDALERLRAGFRKRDYRGAKNPAWKGGVRGDTRGRVLEYLYQGKRNNVIPRARRVAAEAVGRPIAADEDVHHKNGIKDDDRPENLEVRTHANHAKLHSASRPRDPATGRWL